MDEGSGADTELTTGVDNSLAPPGVFLAPTGALLGGCYNPCSPPPERR